MSKLDLISNLDSESKNPTKKFWMFEAMVGATCFSIKVPLENSERFEQECSQKRPDSKTALVAIANRHGGIVT